MSSPSCSRAVVGGWRVFSLLCWDRALNQGLVRIITFVFIFIALAAGSVGIKLLVSLVDVAEPPPPPGSFYDDEDLRGMDFRLANMSYYFGNSRKLTEDMNEVKSLIFLKRNIFH